jgi:5'-nucleotidase
MKLLVDVDGTLNLLPYDMVEEMEKLGFKPNAEKVYKTWNMRDWYDDREEAEKKIHEIFIRPKFFENLTVIDNAIEVLSSLSSKHEVYIATMPYWGNNKCVNEKINWLQKYFPFIDEKKYIFMTDKWLINAEIIIDDKPLYIDKWHSISICMDWPYNREAEASQRVNSWTEVYELLK